MRVTNSPASRKRRGRMLTAAKGFRLKRSKLYRYASDAVDHGRQYAYRDRRVKKRTFRYLWQIRINAAVREARPDLQPFHGRPQSREDRSRPQGARRPRRDRCRRVWRNRQRRQGRVEEQARRDFGQGLIQADNILDGRPAMVARFSFPKRPAPLSWRPHESGTVDRC